MFDFTEIMLTHVDDLKPYCSARNELPVDANISLDANESPFGNRVNRYLHPLQKKLSDLVASQRNLDLNQTFIGQNQIKEI